MYPETTVTWDNEVRENININTQCKNTFMIHLTYRFSFSKAQGIILQRTLLSNVGS